MSKIHTTEEILSILNKNKKVAKELENKKLKENITIVFNALINEWYDLLSNSEDCTKSYISYNTNEESVRDMLKEIAIENGYTFCYNKGYDDDYDCIISIKGA